MKLRRNLWMSKAMLRVYCLLLSAIFCMDQSFASELNEKVAQIRIGSSDLEEVIEIFDAPVKYIWGQETFTRDNLPSRYIADFGDDFRVFFSQGRAVELRCLGPGFMFKNKIQVGSSLDHVVEVLGHPSRIVEKAQCDWHDNVIYKDIDNNDGYCYWARADQGVRFFFTDYKVNAIYLTAAVSANSKKPVRSFQNSTHVSLPKIDRRPPPAQWGRGKLASIPDYDPKSRDSFEVDLRSYDLSALDLRESLDALVQADYDDRTVWPSENRMPPDFKPEITLELGKDPGLGIRDLHARGIDGRGVGIAILDQPLLVDHQEYSDRLRFYEEINYDSGSEAAMHGCAVASIAVGKTVGVAPGADLYYIANRFVDFHGNKEGYSLNFEYLAQGVRRILAINCQLPHDRKIRVVSIARGWSPKEKGYDEIMAAARAAKDAGILLVCSSIDDVHGFHFHGLGRPPLDDPNQIESYGPGSWWADRFYENPSHPSFANRLMVPMDSRTTASPCGNDEYVFYRKGGWSWSIPYIAGFYALAVQVDPSITPDRFWELALKTGRKIQLDHDELLIPLGIIADPKALIDHLQDEL